MSSTCYIDVHVLLTEDSWSLYQEQKQKWVVIYLQ